MKKRKQYIFEVLKYVGFVFFVHFFTNLIYFLSDKENWNDINTLGIYILFYVICTGVYCVVRSIRGAMLKPWGHILTIFISLLLCLYITSIFVDMYYGENSWTGFGYMGINTFVIFYFVGIIVLDVFLFFVQFIKKLTNFEK